MDFEAIYQENVQRVLNLCYRMTGNEQAARDLSQDIWLKIYQNLDKFEGKSRVSTWIYRIAVNEALNFLKKEKRKRFRELLNLDVKDAIGEKGNRLPADIFSGSGNPELALQKKEREKLMWHLVLKLPEKQRVPLVLLRYEGLSYQEIAEVMGISMSAVESRLHRAKKKLQQLLEPYVDQI